MAEGTGGVTVKAVNSGDVSNQGGGKGGTEGMGVGDDDNDDVALAWSVTPWPTP
jgi:hypothetical protein